MIEEGKISGKCYAYDINKDLIMLYKELKNRTFEIPEWITKEEYYTYKQKEPSAMRAYVGLVYSYAGGWFNTYYPISKDGQNFVNSSNRELINIMDNGLFNKVLFSHKDYRQLLNMDIKNALIYCDPPYSKTLQRYNSNPKSHKICKSDFDHKEFWSVIRELSEHNTVIVSETKAPRDFKCIWSKTIYVGVLRTSQKDTRTEKLFIYNPKTDDSPSKSFLKSIKSHKVNKTIKSNKVLRPTRPIRPTRHKN
jgi:site-specific DNA-adenine methylase